PRGRVTEVDVVAELEDAGVDGGLAGAEVSVGVGSGQGQRAGAGLGDALAAPNGAGDGQRRAGGDGDDAFRGEVGDEAGETKIIGDQGRVIEGERSAGDRPVGTGPDA